MALSGLALAGCNTPVPGADADVLGDAATRDTGAPDGNLPDSAAGDAGDRSPPLVIATSPADGAVHVPVDGSLSAAFSEAIAPESGTLTLEADGTLVALGAATWSNDATRLTVSPVLPLAPGATVTWTIAGFEDLSGNALAVATVITFGVEDVVAPTIVRTTPDEGAAVDVTSLTTIEIETSEPLRTDRGTAVLIGPGTPTLGAPMVNGTTLSFSVGGLAPGAAYELTLSGFTDVAGNALDLAALGSDGRLDFATSAIAAPPTVVASAPREGQLDVEVALLSQISLRFSEPMDTSVGALALVVDGGAPVPLTARWDGDRRVLASVAGLLGAVAPHRVILTGFADASGAPLDGTAYLGDGTLDFTTGVDSFPPFVAFMDPAEGATAAPADTDRVLVTFSEAMDPTQTSATLVGDGRSVTVSGTWSAGNTILTLDAPMLQGGRSYTIDFGAFHDAGGTSLDVAHPYLGDGVADFALATPRGERCGDSLTEDQAIVGPSGTVWTLAAGSVTASDGSARCDLDGHPADAVVRYRKTSATSVLHVTAVGATSAAIDLEIFQDACRPTAPTADAARLRCLPERTSWESWLEVPAGDYFLWVSQEAGATFAGATITVEEVDDVRAGESCAAPFDTSSDVAIYTPPATPGAAHRWTIPASYALGLDRGVEPDDDAAAISCLPSDASLGNDAVVHFEKTSPTSLVTVRVALPADGSVRGAVEIARGCDPRDAGYAAVGCTAFSGTAVTREETFSGPAGPFSAWLVEQHSLPLPGGGWTHSPAATIEVSEFEPQAGDSCATAIPLTVGANAVTATRPNRAYVPACLATGGVTWYRFTPTQGLALVRGDGATLGAVVERASGRVIRCGDDLSGALPVFGVPGEEVCIAVASTPTLHSLSIEEIPYTGNRGIETELPIVRDPSLGITPTFGASGPMVVRAGRLLRAGNPVMFAPTAGGLYNFLTPSGTLCRSQMVSRPEGVYCLTASSTATGSRVFRVFDASGELLPTPEVIDVLPTGFTYPMGQRLDGLAWDGATLVAATSATSVLVTADVSYYYAVPTDGSGPRLLGTNNFVNDVSGLAVDADYVYVAGRAGTSEGVFRLARAMLSDPDQLPVELVGGLDLAADGAGIAVNDTTAATALYFRTLNRPTADVLVIVEPRAATPRWIGPLWRAPGTRQDNSFGIDPATGSVWLLHTNATTLGTWVRLD
ncbi:MAG: Ig-like domain-containing protein [Sandaracinus sp.]